MHLIDVETFLSKEEIAAVNYESLYKDIQNVLIKTIAAEFVVGIKLIENLNDEVYTKVSNGTASVGAQFRHNLDFANSFLNGLNAGRIDYNLRERDVMVEQDRQYAIERFIFLIRRLHELPSQITRRMIMVSSEIEQSTWHLSSASRELEFLHSHTVHHHALIAEKLASMNVKLSAGFDSFGVAPSTLKFWAEQPERNQAA